MNVTTITSKEEFLLKADIYRLFSKCFAYPDVQNLREIPRIITELNMLEKVDPVIKCHLTVLQDVFNEQELVNEYSRVFIRGMIPLTESNCCASLNSVADVSAFYRAFGLDAKSGEAPDSLMHELEFLAILCVKAALAPNNETAEVTTDAYKKFISEHLLDFIEKFKEKTDQTGTIPFYSHLIQFVQSFLDKEKILN